jgi:hypothetical protein
MAMAMVIVIVGMALGALMVPIIVTQSKNTTHSDTRVQALHQAESGIDAMLGLIRGATADGVSGAPTLLPCAPVSWPNAPAPVSGYTVTVKYSTDTQTDLGCPGTSLDAETNLPVVPTFATITSTGTDIAGTRTSSRTLDTTYAFSTTDIFNLNQANSSTAGGQIRLNPRAFFDEDETQCLAAPGVPEAGMPLAVQACSTQSTPTNLPMQQFFYDSNLSLRLARSMATAPPNGLCVSMSTTSNAVTMEPCLTAGSGFIQQWTLNADAAFVATPSSPPLCLAVRATGTNIVTKACQPVNTYDSTASWLPTPSVGTGAAGAANSQLVNFSQFGRCAQVANQGGPTSGSNPFILYPCEQRVVAVPSAVPWFQQFTYSSTGRWELAANPADSTKYCLTSQGVVNRPVLVTECAAVATPNQKWTDYGAANQATAGQWRYVQRYRIVDYNNLCMSLNPTTDSNAAFVNPITGQNYSTITSETCDGSAPQKWNAAPPAQSTTPARVKNTTEG